MGSATQTPRSDGERRHRQATKRKNLTLFFRRRSRPRIWFLMETALPLAACAGLGLWSAERGPAWWWCRLPPLPPPLPPPPPPRPPPACVILGSTTYRVVLDESLVASVDWWLLKGGASCECRREREARVGEEEAGASPSSQSRADAADARAASTPFISSPSFAGPGAFRQLPPPCVLALITIILHVHPVAPFATRARQQGSLPAVRATR